MNNLIIKNNDFLVLDKKRKNGISGHLRIRNQGFMIDDCIKSIIDFLDELIITYNDCSDNTEQILMKYKNNKKIKIYKYDSNLIFNKKKIVHKEKTLSNYCNFGLIKISYKWYMKIDVDQIYNKEKLLKIREKILNGDENNIYYFNGLNINSYNNNFYIYFGTRFNNYYLRPINGGTDHFCLVPNSSFFYSDSVQDKYSIEKANGRESFKEIWLNDIFWIHLGSLKSDIGIKRRSIKNGDLISIDDLFNNQNKDFNEYKFFKKKWLIPSKNRTLLFKIPYFLIKKIFLFFEKDIFMCNYNDMLNNYIECLKKIHDSRKFIFSHAIKFNEYLNGFICNDIENFRSKKTF